MAEKREKFRSIREARKILTLVLILVLIAALCFGVGFLTGGRSDDESPKLSTVVVQNQLEQISELATAQYHYTNMGQFEQSNDFYGVKIPFSGKHFIVSYDGTILAGVDLSKAEIKVSASKVSITLPEAKILSHEIDENSLEVFDETKNIFNPLTIENYNQFYAEQKDEIEAKALEGGLLTEAEDQAELAIKQVLEPTMRRDGIALEIVKPDRNRGEAKNGGKSDVENEEQAGGGQEQEDVQSGNQDDAQSGGLSKTQENGQSAVQAEKAGEGDA